MERGREKKDEIRKTIRSSYKSDVEGEKAKLEEEGSGKEESARE